MKNEECDVVVIGGGPAGSYAAKFASEAGVRTVLLERKSNIGIPVRCGEAISLSIDEFFFPVEKKFAASTIRRGTIVAPDGTIWEYLPKKKLGYILDRLVFDRYLAQEAAASGAGIRTKCQVEELIFNDDKISGVVYKYLGNRYTLKAKVVIAADGVESQIGRQAGISSQIQLDNAYSTYQMTVSGVEFDPEEVQLHIGDEIAPKGYVWVFPKSSTSANIGAGIGVTEGRDNDENAYYYVRKFIKRRYGEVSVLSETSGLVPGVKPLKKPFSERLLLAGDAAHFIYPLSGGGIFTAMYSGKYAGKTAAEAVIREDYSEKFLQKYVKYIGKEIIANNMRAFKVKKALDKLPDEILNRTIREMVKIPPEKRKVRDLFLYSLKGNPKLVVDIIRTLL